MSEWMDWIRPNYEDLATLVAEQILSAREPTQGNNLMHTTTNSMLCQHHYRLAGKHYV